MSEKGLVLNMLPPGEYKTQAGSTMTISGQYGGVSHVEFDWLEEPGACCECQVEPYDVDGYLIWNCEHCGHGSAKLMATELAL